MINWKILNKYTKYPELYLYDNSNRCDDRNIGLKIAVIFERIIKMKYHCYHIYKRNTIS